MSARSARSTPGISWPVAMRPQPIWPTRMRLLGASAPSRRDGMIIGNAAAAVARPARRQNSRREREREVEDGWLIIRNGRSSFEIIQPAAWRNQKQRTGQFYTAAMKPFA